MAENNFKVKEAVWIAAALHAFTAFKNGNNTLEDICLTATELESAASQYTENTVQSPRVYMHYNADHEENTTNYLREVMFGTKKKFRVTAPGEFAGEKEIPEAFTDSINSDITFNTLSGTSVTLNELNTFLKEEYSSFILNNNLSSVSNNEIDYIGVLDYLNNNQEIPYSDPDSPDITASEKEHFEEMRSKGQWVVGEMKKMADKSKQLFNIDTYNPGSWLDGSRTKTRKYLWTQLKYRDYFDLPISVSIFAEKNATVTRFRISLELKNDGIPQAIVDQYHKHLDWPLTDGMTYATHVNEWGNPTPTSESVEALKKKLETGEERKVQICIFVESDGNKTNSMIDDEVMSAIGKLIPYYEHVLGTGKAGGWWPPLKDYNPGITSEQWYDFLLTEYKPDDVKFEMLKALYENGPSSCKGLATILGRTFSVYNAHAFHLGDDANKRFSVLNEEIYSNGIKVGPTSIPFLGRTENGLYVWKLRDELKEALSKMDLSNVKSNSNIRNEEFDKNTILYGPPGTGKTYNSARIAVAICDGIKTDELKDYDAVMDRYNELKAEGRIAFTTFHQSYGYEEFIEGIKPVMDDSDSELSYKVESGVFKSFCEKASIPSNINIASDASIWFVRIADKQFCFENNHLVFNRPNDRETDAWFIERFADKMKIGDLVISYAGSGEQIDAIGEVTGNAEYNDAKCIWDRAVLWHTLDVPVNVKSINNGKSLPNFEIAQIKHMSISDLVKLIPDVQEDALKPCVFVIDEINRGNISKIFGELITLIENTKRAGEPEAASCTLPYSGSEFSVPNNVYILGTMNTADRSISLLDTALRRRFSFIEMMPNSDVLRDMEIGTIEIEGTTLNVANMLDAINERINFLFDREHTIGHAFFTGLLNDPSIEKLASIFEKNVIPLLQEYFYEDYQKIQLVLGDNAKQDDSLKFVVDKKVKLKELFMGSVEDIVDEQEVKYEINHDAFKNIEAYKTIAEDL